MSAASKKVAVEAEAEAEVEKLILPTCTIMSYQHDAVVGCHVHETATIRITFEKPTQAPREFAGASPCQPTISA